MSNKPEWVYPIGGLAWLAILGSIVTFLHTNSNDYPDYNAYKTRPISQPNKRS